MCSALRGWLNSLGDRIVVKMGACLAARHIETGALITFFVQRPNEGEG